jgi:hypothetical protein
MDSVWPRGMMFPQALHAPHGSREITFEIASGDSHYVSFFSRNAPEEYKKPHLNIASTHLLYTRCFLSCIDECLAYIPRVCFVSKARRTRRLTLIVSLAVCVFVACCMTRLPILDFLLSLVAFSVWGDWLFWFIV